MESQTYIKNIRISGKKLRFLADDIKKRNPSEVLPYLNYSPKRGSRVFYKAIQSAIANAKLKLKTTDELLRFKLLTVEHGRKIKRYRAGGRGTAKPIERKTAHIKIILVAAKDDEKTAEKVKPEIKSKSEPKVKSRVKKVAAKKK
jgi:large subunit ribosomal protein L22